MARLRQLWESLELEILRELEATNRLRESADFELYELTAKEPEMPDRAVAKQTALLEKEISGLAGEAERLEKEIEELTFCGWPCHCGLSHAWRAHVHTNLLPAARRARRRGAHFADGLECAAAHGHGFAGADDDHLPVVVTLLSLALVWVSGTVNRGSLPAFQALPKWAWFGGIFAGYYLVASLVAIPRLGAAAVFSLVSAGQMIAALILDSTGAFGVTQLSLTTSRVLGALLLLGGVVLLQRK